MWSLPWCRCAELAGMRMLPGAGHFHTHWQAASTIHRLNSRCNAGLAGAPLPLTPLVLLGLGQAAFPDASLCGFFGNGEIGPAPPDELPPDNASAGHMMGYSTGAGKQDMHVRGACQLAAAVCWVC